MGSIGPLELGIVLLIVLLIFGPKRLPSLGRQLGGGMREFKDSITGKSKDDEADDDREKPALEAPPASPPVTPATTALPEDPAEEPSARAPGA